MFRVILGMHDNEPLAGSHGKKCHLRALQQEALCQMILSGSSALRTRYVKAAVLDLPARARRGRQQLGINLPKPPKNSDEKRPKTQTQTQTQTETDTIWVESGRPSR